MAKKFRITKDTMALGGAITASIAVALQNPTREGIATAIMGLFAALSRGGQNTPPQPPTPGAGFRGF